MLWVTVFANVSQIVVNLALSTCKCKIAKPGFKIVNNKPEKCKDNGLCFKYEKPGIECGCIKADDGFQIVNNTVTNCSNVGLCSTYKNAGVDCDCDQCADKGCGIFNDTIPQTCFCVENGCKVGFKFSNGTCVDLKCKIDARCVKYKMGTCDCVTAKLGFKIRNNEPQFCSMNGNCEYFTKPGVDCDCRVCSRNSVKVGSTCCSKDNGCAYTASDVDCACQSSGCSMGFVFDTKNSKCNKCPNQNDCLQFKDNFGVYTCDCKKYKVKVSSTSLIIGVVVGIVVVIIVTIMGAWFLYTNRKKTKDLLNGLTPQEFIKSEFGGDNTIILLSDGEYNNNNDVTTRNSFDSTGSRRHPPAENEGEVQNHNTGLKSGSYYDVKHGSDDNINNKLTNEKIDTSICTSSEIIYVVNGIPSAGPTPISTPITTPSANNNRKVKPTVKAIEVEERGLEGGVGNNNNVNKTDNTEFDGNRVRVSDSHYKVTLSDLEYTEDNYTIP
eukprot:Pgem_evm1s11530